MSDINWEKVAEALSEEVLSDQEKIQQLEEANTKLINLLAVRSAEGIDELRIKVLEMENELAVAGILLEEEYENHEAIRTLVAVNAQMYCLAAIAVKEPNTLHALYRLSRLGDISTEGKA